MWARCSAGDRARLPWRGRVVLGRGGVGVESPPRHARSVLSGMLSAVRRGLFILSEAAGLNGFRPVERTTRRRYRANKVRCGPISRIASRFLQFAESIADICRAQPRRRQGFRLSFGRLFAAVLPAGYPKTGVASSALPGRSEFFVLGRVQLSKIGYDRAINSEVD